MKPYYQDDSCTIYHGDCREIMPELDHPDFIFADPPYGVGFDYASHDDSRDGYQEFIRSWFHLLRPERMAITPGIVNVCLYPQPRWILAWLKLNSMGANMLSGPSTVSRNLWEPVLWYGKYPPNQISRDTVNAPISTEERLGHPCPKPIQLISMIVSFATTETDVVLDPFVGSGTTLRAAKDLGRKAIGIEIEERYCEIAARRLAQEVLPFK